MTTKDAEILEKVKMWIAWSCYARFPGFCNAMEKYIAMHLETRQDGVQDAGLGRPRLPQQVCGRGRGTPSRDRGDGRRSDVRPDLAVSAEKPNLIEAAVEAVQAYALFASDALLTLVDDTMPRSARVTSRSIRGSALDAALVLVQTAWAADSVGLDKALRDLRIRLEDVAPATARLQTAPRAPGSAFQSPRPGRESRPSGSQRPLCGGGVATLNSAVTASPHNRPPVRQAGWRRTIVSDRPSATAPL